jgi:hypothetical protein
MRGQFERFQQRAQLVDGKRLLEKIALVIRDFLLRKKLLRVATSRSSRANVDFNFALWHITSPSSSL